MFYHVQICIAIAALAVHVPVEDWGGGGIVNWLGDEMKSQQEFIPSFLELLIILPQVHNKFSFIWLPISLRLSNNISPHILCLYRGKGIKAIRS